MSKPKSLRGFTRHIMTFYKTSSSYDWQELEDALKNRGYEIFIREEKNNEITAEVYLTKISNLIPLISLCEANHWIVGYANDPKRRLTLIYVRGKLSIEKIEN
ncbi:MAG: hypothetical protein QXZ43_01820 [Candidatus Aenigmatarchaeota archaeon]